MNNTKEKLQIEEEYQDYLDTKNRDLEESNDATKAILPPQDVVAFNEQRSCADILRMVTKKQLDINPDFQRNVVWSSKAQTLFVDSLLKQLPIPSLCISLDIKTNKRYVIDGLQRITSIVKFLSDDSEWILSKIEDADDRISGKSVLTIRKENPMLVEDIENVSIPITVLRCDFDNDIHMEYLFQIFNRLNTGGVKLYNQEIRNCIFQGPFNSLLKNLAVSKEWIEFSNITEEKVRKSRMANEEKILRFLAFYYDLDNYKGSLAGFLNQYMKKNRNASEEYLKEYKQIFENTLSIACELANKPTSKNVSDAILIGIAKNIGHLKNKNKQEIDGIYDRVIHSEEFSSEELREGLGSKEKVVQRIRKSIELFGV